MRPKRGRSQTRPGPAEVFKAEGVNYVWAMAQTADGNLYAATGPQGQLFEIKPDGTSRVVLDSDENNLTALLSDGKDMLYVGTDPNGLVYRVNRKTGESFVLFDAPEAEISALVMDKKGNLYASTAEARAEGPSNPAKEPEAGGRPGGGHDRRADRVRAAEGAQAAGVARPEPGPAGPDPQGGAVG